jgi:hypothetical protein
MRSRTRLAAWSIAGLVAVVAWLEPSAARAESAAVVVGGAAPSGIKEVALRAVRQRIVERQWFVRDVDIPEARVKAVIQCLGTEASPSCTTGLIPKDVDRLVVLSVRPDTEGGEDVTNVTAWVVSRTGELLVADGRICERCRAPVMETLMGDLVVSMWREIVSRSGRTVLKVRVTPASAKASILVDGELVGSTEVEYGVYPGMRNIEARAPGYCPEIRNVNARVQELVPVTIELRACRDKKHWWPWAVVGAGGAIALTGGVLLAIDDDHVEGNVRTFEGRDTAPWGLGLVAAGGVTIGAGVFWLLRSPRGESESAPASGPVLSLGKDSGWLGYQGRF